MIKYTDPVGQGVPPGRWNRLVRMNKIVKPIECLRGEISLPGDKSISHRVVFIGSIAKGKTFGRNFLKAEDCLRTVSAFREMGIEIKLEGSVG